jgi:hypothetical protein
VTFQQAVQCGFNIPFRGRLCPGLLEQWNYIKNDVVLIPRANTTDQVVWALTSKKKILLNLCINSWRETFLGLIIN